MLYNMTRKEKVRPSCGSWKMGEFVGDKDLVKMRKAREQSRKCSKKKKHEAQAMQEEVEL